MTDEPHSPPDSSRANRYREGDVIDDKYRLICPIGEGGMGVVWRSENTVLDIEVALKLISKVGSDEELIAKRFLQEARTAAQLAHPAICRVFDYGRTHHNDPFIVSELLKGCSLGDAIDESGHLEVIEAIQTILPIVDGLSVAHAKGIVHRDVKSDNIFLAKDLSERAQPKLLDFGVARFARDDNKITVEGTLLGTPNYMSPEQARGDSSYDYRTDIWSLCIVIYELTTGVTPFEGENYNAVLWQILNLEPKPITEYGAGDTGLWKIIEKGLARDPMGRWDSMRELGGALASWLYGLGVREDLCGASLRATWLESGADSRIGLPPLAQSADPFDRDEAGSASAGPISHPWRTANPSASTLLGVTRNDVHGGKSRRKVAFTVGAMATSLLIFGAWLASTLRSPRPDPVDAGSSQAALVAPPRTSARSVAAKGERAELKPPAPDPSPRSGGGASSDSEIDAGVDSGAQLVSPRGRTTRAPRKRRAKNAGNPDFGF